MPSLLGALEALEREASAKLATLKSIAEVQEFRTNYLGKKGALTNHLKEMGSLSAEERPAIGKKANEIKMLLESKLSDIEIRISAQERDAEMLKQSIDVSLPGRIAAPASLHPISQTTEEIVRIFSRMGFTVALGPEVEEEFYNFDALNIPDSHPSRDMHDTFYVRDGVVLRTHTSPVQIRTMIAHEPPLRILAPGRVYRSDYDVSHTPMFHQVEGLLVDSNVSFADLKGSLQHFARCFFGNQAELRFRPSFFPFTEPSAEVDVRCVFCEGQGCRACKETGWLEVLGCGMVDPEVFKSVHYDPLKWTGYAFGFGVERMAMLKYGIPDIRIFFENDMRFLNQFRSLKWRLWTNRLSPEDDIKQEGSKKDSSKEMRPAPKGKGA